MKFRKGEKKHTLARLDTGAPFTGVPSRLSPVFAFDNGSSRIGRTVRSAYFRQLRPQLSQRMLVGSPFGAFHQTSDSRVRHAPQLLWPFLSSVTMEPSSSSGVGSRTEASCFSSTPFARAARIRIFSSFSLELRTAVSTPDRVHDGRSGDILLPVAIEANNFGHWAGVYFLADGPQLGAMERNAVLEGSNFVVCPLLVSVACLVLHELKRR